MKKIGFVDYYISEWHANSYPAWIKEAAEKQGAEYKIAYVWAEEYVSPVDGRNTDEWCEAYGAASGDSAFLFLIFAARYFHEHAGRLTSHDLFNF